MAQLDALRRRLLAEVASKLPGAEPINPDRFAAAGVLLDSTSASADSPDWADFPAISDELLPALRYSALAAHH